MTSRHLCRSCGEQFRYSGGKGGGSTDFLDTFKDPIFVVDSDGVVKTANEPARSARGKSAREIEEWRRGEGQGVRERQRPYPRRLRPDRALSGLRHP